MNNSRINNALNYIDDCLISEAIDYKHEKKRNTGIKWIASAACFIGIIVASIVLINNTRKNGAAINNDTGIHSEVDNKKDNDINSEDVIYIMTSTDWPYYETTEEIVAAGNIIVSGKITGISFQVLDLKTGKKAENEAEGMLHTIYNIDVISVYKGNNIEKLEVRVPGGLHDQYLKEQLSTLGERADKGIELIAGNPELQIGQSYLFILKQYEDSIPDLINLTQGAIKIDDQLATEIITSVK